MHFHRHLVGIVLLIPGWAYAQDAQSPNPKERTKALREFAREGSEAIPKIEPLLSDPDRDVRMEAVRALTAIGTQHSLQPLMQAAKDNDPVVQMAAADGLVNFYLPGYVESGIGAFIKKTFSGEDTRIVPLFVKVREDVVLALGRMVKSGSSTESRANAARAIGVLRGNAGLPALVEGLHSKNDEIIYESLIAIQKIRDPEAAPKISFLLRDLKEKVQVAAIETTGLLQNEEAIPDLSRVYENTRNKKVRKAAITALAMLPDESTRPVYRHAFTDKDDEIRAAAAEGYARLKNPSDKGALEQAFATEEKMKPRLALAFALVNLGDTRMAEFTPLQYLVNTLNSRLYSGIAEAYLRELARTAEVRNAIYPALRTGTKPEKIALGRVLAVSGDEGSVAHLETLSKDPDTEVAQEGLKSLRNLKARIL